MSITPNNLDYTINEVFYEILIKTFEQWKVDINLLNKTVCKAIQDENEYMRL